MIDNNNDERPRITKEHNNLPLSKNLKITILESAVESLIEVDSSGRVPIPFSRLKERYLDLERLICSDSQTTA